jgi:hypothetical protein
MPLVGLEAEREQYERRVPAAFASALLGWESTPERS